MEGRRYIWHDNEQEVHVQMHVPSDTVARDVSCVFKQQWLRLEVATVEPSLVIDSCLFGPIVAGESTWVLEPAVNGMRQLTLTLDKRVQKRWSKLLRVAEPVTPDVSGSG
jgi:hypothetical protein